ncbi:MAG: N-acetylmuramoyl-L-alanine amidase [Candidatus Kryptoniota bacterium]
MIKPNMRIFANYFSAFLLIGANPCFLHFAIRNSPPLSLLRHRAIGGQQSISSPCDKVKIENHLIGWGHRIENREHNIEAIIIHSSYNALGSDSFNIDGILREYRDIKVSPHYVINRGGTIYQLVADKDVAYHAGKSRLPDGKKDVNAVSIGIEIINTENDSPTEVQYLSLANLVKCLKSKYPIKYVLGHSDIAPGRKTDPWNFDWRKFDDLLRK